VRDRWQAGDADPACERCGGILKPKIVFFGEDLPRDATDRAAEMVDAADAVLVIGSSLAVYPAAFIPLDVAGRGHPFVIVNEGPTDHDAPAKVRIDARAGLVVPELVAAITGKTTASSR
jgi:NAD-dependent SIR2 family protein deacetylase